MSDTKKKVIVEHSGWKRMSEKEELRSWSIDEIVTWYYNNHDVIDVQFLNNGAEIFAYITIMTKLGDAN